MTESEKNEYVTKGFLEERLTVFEERLDKKMEEKFVTQTMFESAMAIIARSFEKVEERFIRIEEKLSGIDERFNSIDAGITKILESMQRNEEEHREFRNRLNENDRSIFVHEREINNLSERMELIEKKA